jgi:hypothetical protein
VALKQPETLLNRLPSEPIDFENDVTDWVLGIFSFYLENNSQPIAPEVLDTFRQIHISTCQRIGRSPEAPIPNKPPRWPEWIDDWERICDMGEHHE